MLSIAGILALTAAMASAADVSGKWVAQVPGRDGQTRELTFNFTVNGDQLTGTITTPRGDSEISDGKVTGNQISFTQTMNFGGNEMKAHYTGNVAEDGNSIDFTRSMERPGGDNGGGGERRGGGNRTFTAKRASS